MLIINTLVVTCILSKTNMTYVQLSNVLDVCPCCPPKPDLGWRLSMVTLVLFDVRDQVFKPWHHRVGGDSFSAGSELKQCHYSGKMTFVSKVCQP